MKCPKCGKKLVPVKRINEEIWVCECEGVYWGGLAVFPMKHIEENPEFIENGYKELHDDPPESDMLCNVVIENNKFDMRQGFVVGEIAQSRPGDIVDWKDLKDSGGVVTMELLSNYVVNRKGELSVMYCAGETVMVTSVALNNRYRAIGRELFIFNGSCIVGKLIGEKNSEKTTDCPQCGGHGNARSGFRCVTCGGTGEVPDEEPSNRCKYLLDDGECCYNYNGGSCSVLISNGDCPREKERLCPECGAELVMVGAIGSFACSTCGWNV